MGFSKNTQATRSTLMSVDSTLAANIDATQDYIPIASTTNFSTSIVAEIETTNEVVSFGSITSNLVARSEEFDNGYWAKTRQTVVANAGVAPDGTTTADNSIPDSGAQSNVQIYRTINAGTADRTVSIFAKPNGFDYISVIFQSGVSNTMGVQFNVSDGTIAASNDATGTITDVGSGWYRCSTVADTSTYSNYVIYQVSDGATPGSYFNAAVTGDGAKGVLIWGAQLETTALTGYLPTGSSALEGLTDVTRGVNGTTAAVATSGDSIQQLPYALSDLNMPTRLKAISVASDGTGAGRFTLCDKIGTTLLDIDLPDTSLYELDFGDDRGIIFPNGIYVANSDNLTAYTLFTDKHSGTGLS
jgi:hypothetical protein